jgi:hypothetical protein
MSFEHEIEDLESTADWRRRKAEEYPDDERNLAAAETIDLLLKSLNGPETSGEKVEIFDRFNELIYSGSSSGEDSPEEVSRLWSDYRREIGFRRFPASGAEYLDDLMEIARNV